MKKKHLFTKKTEMQKAYECKYTR